MRFQLEMVSDNSPHLGGLPLAGLNNASSSGTLLKDSFTDSNGTALTSHTMDTGAGWTQIVGSSANLTIQSNRAQAAVSEQMAVADAGASDVTASGTLNMNGGAGGFGLLARVQDASNFFELVFTTSQLQLYERSAGTYTLRGAASISVTNSSDHTLQLVCTGTSLSGTIDGGSTVSYSSSDFQTKTKFGLDLAASWQADNFLVTQ